MSKRQKVRGVRTQRAANKQTYTKAFGRVTSIDEYFGGRIQVWQDHVPVGGGAYEVRYHIKVCRGGKWGTARLNRASWLTLVSPDGAEYDMCLTPTADAGVYVGFTNLMTGKLRAYACDGLRDGWQIESAR